MPPEQLRPDWSLQTPELPTHLTGMILNICKVVPKKEQIAVEEQLQNSTIQLSPKKKLSKVGTKYSNVSMITELSLASLSAHNPKLNV